MGLLRDGRRLLSRGLEFLTGGDFDLGSTLNGLEIESLIFGTNEIEGFLTSADKEEATAFTTVDAVAETSTRVVLGSRSRLRHFWILLNFLLIAIWNPSRSRSGSRLLSRLFG